jgi:hypothetical protein
VLICCKTNFGWRRSPQQTSSVSLSATTENTQLTEMNCATSWAHSVGNESHAEKCWLFGIIYIRYKKCQDSSVGVATRLPTGQPRSKRSIPDTGKRFLLPRHVQTSSEAHSASYTWVPWAISSGVKRQRREADHLPISGAKIKNRGAISPLPQTFLRLEG